MDPDSKDISFGCIFPAPEPNAGFPQRSAVRVVLIWLCLFPNDAGALRLHGHGGLPLGMRGGRLVRPQIPKPKGMQPLPGLKLKKTAFPCLNESGRF
jgi:hypothetical protein